MVGVNFANEVQCSRNCLRVLLDVRQVVQHGLDRMILLRPTPMLNAINKLLNEVRREMKILAALLLVIFAAGCDDIPPSPVTVPTGDLEFDGHRKIMILHFDGVEECQAKLQKWLAEHTDYDIESITSMDPIGGQMPDKYLLIVVRRKGV